MFLITENHFMKKYTSFIHIIYNTICLCIKWPWPLYASTELTSLETNGITGNQSHWRYWEPMALTLLETYGNNGTDISGNQWHWLYREPIAKTSIRINGTDITGNQYCWKVTSYTYIKQHARLFSVEYQ